jgi:hypothetical protein
MRPTVPRVLTVVVGVFILNSGRLEAQRELTIGLGIGRAAAHAQTAAHSGLQLTLAAERALNRRGWIAARVDGMLVDWREGHWVALTANAVLYRDPATKFSPYVIAGAGAYGLGHQALGGANVGVGLRYRRARTALFADLRLHELRGVARAIPALTVGVRF